ncbi:YfhH family protein [Aquibacillus salsiterrae]|uniref:YfhH family protein n=1 Tax=Aquibacillus salsiterrae TaxID=2950439 RepID=A0A9X4AHD2_9BACI|nr:YfhH family protein [Aquibacillus salsiterrae]MDC3418195.1 YfhH family protein [Aquibacillus salsiterrae]
MEKRYSEYTVEELRNEIAKLKEKVQKAEQMGNISEYAVFERKIQMAQAYLMNPAEFKKGERYELREDPGQTFEIDYLNGVFAWGHRINLLGKKYEKQEALPISVFGKKLEQ